MNLETVYLNAHMTYAFFDDTPAEEHMDCEVRISDQKLTVTYEDDEGVASYIGTEEGEGHYHLQCEGRNAKATLHRFVDGKILEGYWVEDGVRGFWRIELGQSTSIKIG